MAEVSSVVLKYAVRGADRAQRKDKQVRESIQRTGRRARKESGSIRKWMQRHKAAIAGIAAATAGAMMAVIKHSPTLSGELAGMRLAFSLFAMTVGEDLAPALEGISGTLLDISDAYSDLDEDVRKPISGLIGVALAMVFAATALATLETIIGGTAVAAAFKAIGGAAWSAAGGVLGFIGVTGGLLMLAIAIAAGLGLASSELLGFTNMTSIASTETGSWMGMLAQAVFVLTGPFAAAIAAAVAFWKGGWSNAKRVFKQFMMEWVKLIGRLLAGVVAFMAAIGAAIHTGMEYAWDLGVKAAREGANGVLWAVEELYNGSKSGLIKARNGFETTFEYIANAAKRGMNDTVEVVTSRLNTLIKKANKAPGVNLDLIQPAQFDAKSVDEIAQQSRERLQRRLDNMERLDLDRFSTRTAGEITDAASNRLAERWQMIRDVQDRWQEQMAAEQVQIAPEDGGQSTPGEGTGPSPNMLSPEQRQLLERAQRMRDQGARDGRAPDRPRAPRGGWGHEGPPPTRAQQGQQGDQYTVEELRVMLQSTGDERLDGEQVGESAMQYIEEQQQRRR
jgi:hypothetical protein